MWGGGVQTVDNGTAAWGQASDATSGWVDPDEPGKASGWGNPSPNPGKPGKDLKQKKKTKKTQHFVFHVLMMPQPHIRHLATLHFLV